MKKNGFSLVELSIVLVILGLLAGGVLSGQSLIRAAELRSVTTEFERYSAAIYSFQDKYFALPGDMNNATNFWGRAEAVADCVSNASVAVSTNGKGTCDGNGDGQVTPATGGGVYGEPFGFWKQLANAGLIEGSYNGKAGPGGRFDAQPGTNSPKSRVSNAAWESRWLSDATSADYSGDDAVYAMHYGNIFLIGAKAKDSGPAGPIFKPEEAWNIDTKIDDGKPAQGHLIARWWNDACARADDGKSAKDNLIASYNLSDSTLQCALIFRWGS